MATPEIRKGDFIFRNTLFADLGDNKRHPRAAVSDLRDLLLPKPGSAPAKDQVAHWCEAQLLHYGLPRVKDKNAAKVRLTNAITSKTLVVPAYITQMEAAMKKEYMAALRKGKGAAKKAPDTNTPATSKKRKAEESKTGTDGTTLMRVKINGIELDIDHRPEGSAAASKKARNEPTKTKKSTPKPKAATTKTPSSNTRKPKVSTLRPTPTTAPAPAPTTSSSQPRHYHAHSESPTPPPPYSSLSFHTAPPATPRRSNTVQISGSYALDSFQSSNPSSSCNPSTMSLRIDHPTSSLWGSFALGPKRGIIYMADTTGLARGDTVTFGYRSEDVNSANKLRFGRGCDGEMRFDGIGGVEGLFAGVMYGGDVEFRGNLVRGAREGEVDVESVRREWEGYPARAYGRV